MTATPRLRLALCGAVAGLAGLVASQVLTYLLGVRATPVQAVAETVVVLTPGRLVEAAISVAGTNDKPILVGAVSMAVVLLGAVAGLLTSRRRILGQAVFAAMGGLALAATVSRPELTPVSLLPLAGGVMCWLLVFDALLAAARPRPGLEASRRRFLLATGGVVVATAVAGAGGWLATRSRRSVEASRRLLRLPASGGVVPAGAEVDLPGLTPWRVPNDEFYRIDTALVLPAADPSEWRLRIHGMVDQELVLSFDDLVRRAQTEAWVTLCCVSNEVGGDLIGNAWWSGVRVADLLAEAGVSPAADAVKQTSEDGWTCGTPLAALTDDRNALLAIAMNGSPLPIEHGFPVRMVVPGLYGYVSATKWVVDLEVTRYEDFTAYWTERGWSVEGPVKTQSRVEVPRSGADVPSGSLRIGGQAWAQHVGIEKVEYRLDGDPWREAELARVPSADTWVQWSGTVEVGSGQHTLAVRATDRSGTTQTAARVDPVPDGATGWHTVEFSAG